MPDVEYSRSELPPIPSKRYFTIGEVSDLCDVKTHVLRYWEQEFNQLKPLKRRGNRRYYQQHDVQMVRQIRSLLYEQGYTIIGARQRLVSLSGSKEPLASGLVEMAGTATMETNEIKGLIGELESVLKLLDS